MNQTIRGNYLFDAFWPELERTFGIVWAFTYFPNASVLPLSMQKVSRSSLGGVANY
jgi:hypothetical protein